MNQNQLPAFHVLAKPAGPICNLDCKYCFYLEKDRIYPDVKQFKMSDEVLESFIRQKIEGHRTNSVHFTWQGGEPTLLGLDYFKQVVALQKKYAGDKAIENGFQTNGLLLDDDWCIFLKEENFLLGISIDGPEAIHDHYRVHRNGQGSFHEVMQGLELFKKHDVSFNTLTVVNAHNVNHADEIYTFLKDIESTFWQFIPIVERTGDGEGLATPDVQAKLTEWSVPPLAYGQFLEHIFQRWVREDVGEIFIQQFESALANHMGMPAGICVWSPECGAALALEHNGDLYPCDHYVFPKYKLGNIMEMPLVDLIHTPEQRQFGRDKKEKLPKVCLNCEVLDLCHGECPKHRFMIAPDGEKGLNYLCEGYKYFFTSIRPELGVFAELLSMGQPAEGIQSWMVQKDAGFPDLDVEPDDPCPCGSGKIFKSCCMA
jgi:uncharacterized protein